MLVVVVVLVIVIENPSEQTDYEDEDEDDDENDYEDDDDDGRILGTRSSLIQACRPARGQSAGLTVLGLAVRSRM